MNVFNSKKSSCGVVKLKTRTWDRDSYGLFDFEAKDVSKNKFKIEKPQTILREKNEISLAKENLKEKLNLNLEKLCKITKSNDEYYVSNWRENDESAFNSQDLWAVIGTKNFENKAYQLKEQEIFKVGRLTFKILQIRTNCDQNLGKNLTENAFISSVKLHYQENLPNNAKSQEIVPLTDTKLPAFSISKEILNDDKALNSRICRICLSDGFENDNPFISPCSCSGSLKFIHFKCLQTWIQSRLHLDKKNGIVSIEWKGLSCELCQKNLPLSIEHDNVSYDLLEIRDQNMNKFEQFIVLESYSKNFKNSGIHYIDFSERNSLSIGRAEISDIRLSDISVSRDHSKIIFEKGKFFLKDGGSKFGTLVLVTNPIRVSPEKQLFQNGRTLLTLQTEKNWFSFFSFCTFSCNNSESFVHNNTEKNKDALHLLIK